MSIFTFVNNIISTNFRHYLVINTSPNLLFTKATTSIHKKKFLKQDDSSKAPSMVSPRQFQFFLIKENVWNLIIFSHNPKVPKFRTSSVFPQNQLGPIFRTSSVLSQNQLGPYLEPLFNDGHNIFCENM